MLKGMAIERGDSDKDIAVDDDTIRHRVKRHSEAVASLRSALLEAERERDHWKNQYANAMSNEMLK